jgi:O-antigen chain-terminating methyltransferase
MELWARQAEAELRANQVNSDLEATRKELHDVHQANHHHWIQLEAIRKELHDVHQSNHHHWQLVAARDLQIQELKTSRSWKITAPMRWIANFILRRRGASAVPPAPTFPDRLIRWGMARPRLVALVKVCLKTVPPLHQKLVQRVNLAMKPDLALVPLVPLVPPDPSLLPDVRAQELETLPPENLPPHARQIYAELKAAIERRQREQA